MKNSISSSRADFYATAILILLIIAAFAFSIFYKKKWPAVEDISHYQTLVDDFYAEQAWLADSADAARAARDSLYRNRPRYYSHYAHRRGWQQYAHRYDSSRWHSDTSSFSPRPYKPQYAIVKVDLNSCDTSEIVRIPQFGAKRAQKLVEYRRKLGGFHSFEQLHEIFVLQNIDLNHCEKYFTIDAHKIKKIFINKFTYKELLAHPYFDAYLAKMVVTYREQHGKIQNITEFQKITHAYPELVEKLRPYLSFD